MMNRLRSKRAKRAKRLATMLAVFGLLVQAGLAVWHGTAMVALSTAQPGAGAQIQITQAQMMCHPAQTEVDPSGGDRSTEDCSCCLGLTPVAAVGVAQLAVAPARVADAYRFAAITSRNAARNFLVPEGRGPPQST